MEQIYQGAERAHSSFSQQMLTSEARTVEQPNAGFAAARENACTALGADFGALHEETSAKEASRCPGALTQTACRVLGEGSASKQIAFGTAAPVQAKKGQKELSQKQHHGKSLDLIGKIDELVAAGSAKPTYESLLFDDATGDKAEEFAYYQMSLPDAKASRAIHRYEKNPSKEAAEDTLGYFTEQKGTVDDYLPQELGSQDMEAASAKMWEEQKTAKAQAAAIPYNDVKARMSEGDFNPYLFSELKNKNNGFMKDVNIELYSKGKFDPKARGYHQKHALLEEAFRLMQAKK